jgi:hypothetical protein
MNIGAKLVHLRQGGTSKEQVLQDGTIRRGPSAMAALIDAKSAGAALENPVVERGG